MLIETKKGRSKNFKFRIDLTDTSYVDTNVLDVWFVLKNSINDTDASAVLIKNAPSVTWVSAGEKFVDVSVPITAAEFDAMELDRTMKGGLFAQFTGEDAANEDVKQTFDFTVRQDLLRDA